MEPLAQNGQQFGQSSNSTPILTKCREIDNGLRDMEKQRLDLKALQTQYVQGVDNADIKKRIEDETRDITAGYKEFYRRIRTMQVSEEGKQTLNQAQLGRLERRIKNDQQEFFRQETDFRTNINAAAKRQIRIAKPDATDEEVDAMIESGETQIFAQALMQSSRRQDANVVLQRVQDRHAQVQKIENTLIELAEMFTQVNEMVEQQEEMIVDIEQKGQEVEDNVAKGTEHIQTAIVSARARNRKKWWCLGICGEFDLGFPAPLSLQALRVGFAR